MRILTVLRSGGEYRPKHVARLRDQCAQWAPQAEFVCLSDIDVPGRIPLQHNWPRWWGKVETCRPDVIGEGVLYCDLDTTIRGPLDDILAVRRLTMLSDFYFPERLQSSLMYVTPEAADVAWRAFMAAPERHMRECTTRERWGDQGFFAGVWRDVQRWDAAVPGQIVSWKVNCRKPQNRREHGNGSVPDEARIIVWHGKPRPWEVEER